MNEIKDYFDKKATEKEFECIDDNKFMFKQRAKYVQKALGNIKNKKVLDLGSGPGYYTKLLIDREAKITAFDLSNKMLSQLPKECKKVQGNATKLPFGDNQFDVIISIEMIQYLNYQESLKCFKEIYRILKPEGKLILTTLNGDWKEISFAKWLREKMRRAPKFYNHHKKSDLENWLKKSGFKNFKVEYFHTSPTKLLKPVTILFRYLIPKFAFNIKVIAIK